MGIIRKQSLYSSIFIYIGFAIGAFNVLILFPNQKYFTPQEFGLTKLLMEVALLISLLATLGTSPAIVKFYPFYSSYLDKKKNDLPAFTLAVVVIGCFLLLLIGPLLKAFIIRKFVDKSPLFVDYFYLLYPFSISMAFMYLFEAFAWAQKRTVLPSFLREVLLRVLTLLLIVLVFTRVINFHRFITLYAYIYVPLVIIQLYDLLKAGNFHFTFKISSVSRRLRKRIIGFSLFIFSGQIMYLLARTLDSIIISSQSKGGLLDTAVFTIATYLVTFMEVPMRGMTGIATSVIAHAWKDRDMKTIHSIYQKTALNLLLLGAGFFGLLLLNIQNIISFLGPTYLPMAQVVLVLGFAKLIDLGTGLNSQILLSSKYWKIDFITNIFLVLLAGILNYFLVRKFNILGSSIANLIAFTVFNFVRFLFIWIFFKMQPFTLNNLKILLIASACFGIGKFIPFTMNIYFDSFVRSVLFIAIYAFVVLKLRISEDINSFYQAIITKLLVILKR